MGLFDFFKSKNEADRKSESQQKDEIYLTAKPISRKQMALLWLDPPKLKQLEQGIAEYGVNISKEPRK